VEKVVVNSTVKSISQGSAEEAKFQCPVGPVARGFRVRYTFVKLVVEIKFATDISLWRKSPKSGSVWYWISFSQLECPFRGKSPSRYTYVTT